MTSVDLIRSKNAAVLQDWADNMSPSSYMSTGNDPRRIILRNARPVLSWSFHGRWQSNFVMSNACLTGWLCHVTYGMSGCVVNLRVLTQAMQMYYHGLIDLIKRCPYGICFRHVDLNLKQGILICFWHMGCAFLIIISYRLQYVIDWWAMICLKRFLEWNDWDFRYFLWYLGMFFVLISVSCCWRFSL